MKQFILFLALALLVHIVVGRAVRKHHQEEQKVEEHPDQNVQEVSELVELIFLKHKYERGSHFLSLQVSFMLE